MLIKKSLELRLRTFIKKPFVLLISLLIISISTFAENHKFAAKSLYAHYYADKTYNAVEQFNDDQTSDINNTSMSDQTDSFKSGIDKEDILSDNIIETTQNTDSENKESIIENAIDIQNNADEANNVDNQNVNEPEKDKDFFSSPLFYLGLISLIVFFIFFRISYKKNIPIFIGIWDIVLLIISALFMAFFMIGLDNGVSKEDIICLIIALVTFVVSIILTLHTPNSFKDKVMSIISKAAFVLSVLVLLIILLFLFITSKVKRKDQLGRQLYDERGHEEYIDTKVWAKVKKYWDEMKKMSRNAAS